MRVLYNAGIEHLDIHFLVYSDETLTAFHR